MKERFLVLLLAGAGLTASAVETATPLAQTRSTIEQWVQTRQLVSKTRTEWQTDRESLEQTIALYERELKALDEQMAKVGTNNTQVEKEMQEAIALQQASGAALERARQTAAGLEEQVRKLAPQLPAPLQDILQPLLARMPPDAANSKLPAAERVQIVVGALNELDKFNNAVSVFSEKRKNPQGAEAAVETVYIGLGAAYFVNEAGDFAGMGIPGAAGWEWTTRNEIASSVREVIRIYRNESMARFVKLPAAIH
jgi:septal ring factor EnvC (AmiA/AmiB activator)